MGILSRWRRDNSKGERRGVQFSDGLLASLRDSFSGSAPVTPQNSMQISSVFACVRVLSESLASLPLILYARQARGKRQATEHPLFLLLRDLPNPEVTSVEMRMWLQGHLSAWGNAYAQIVKARNGQILELWPMRPDRMRVYRQADGWLWYYYAPDPLSEPDVRNISNWYRFDEMLHLRGLGFDGVMGYNPIRLMANSLELAKAPETFGTKFYANGARPGVVLKHPGKLSDAAYARLRNSWEARHQGVDNAHRVAILEEGMGVEEIGIPPQDAQFLETRKFQRGEIAAIFRVPPHMIGDLERASFSNIEQQGMEFIQYTLGSWLRIWEQGIARDLLTAKERTTLFAEHSLDWLMRGDTLARYQAYQSAINAGWITPNEARERENMNPLPGGDNLLQPLNMTPAGNSTGQASARALEVAQGARIEDWLDHTGLPGCTCLACNPVRLATNTAAETRDAVEEQAQTVRERKVKLMRSQMPLFEDCAKRAVKREVQDVRRACTKLLGKRSAADFTAWLTEFYKEFPSVVRANFDALLTSYGEQMTTLSADELGKADPGLTDALRTFIGGYLDSMANAHAAASRRQLEALLADAQMDGSDPAQAINDRLDGWQDSRPAQMARQNSIEFGNAVAVAAYASLGVLYLRWAASGQSCAFCRSLNGKIVDIAGFFVQAGQQLDGGADGQMLVRRNTRHGPIHDGCDCVTVAA